VAERKDKLGYPTPLAQWLRGTLRNEVDAYLHDQVLKRDWYDAAVARDLWRAHTAGERNMERILYRMITAEQWMSQQGA
jgi:hypothetical protein